MGFRVRMATAIIATMALAAASSCQALAAELNYKRVKVGNVAVVNFGAASVDFFPAGGSIEHVSVRPCGRASLTSATFRVFDDLNRDGLWNEGEPQHEFTTVTTPDGFETTDVSLSSNQVRGWRQLRWQIDIVDETGAQHVHSDGF